jgi:hypothetical protein
MLWTRALPTGEVSEAQLKRRFENVELPESAVALAAVTHILSAQLGYQTSFDRGSSVLGDGRPIPLMSYSLIEYLLGLDLSSFDLLELGGGGSTPFWASRTKSVLTLETDAQWHRSMQSRRIPNVEVRLSAPGTLANDMLELGRSFDVIVIDASANRCTLAGRAVRTLRPGGFIILDNSDWYPNAARVLREGDLIQVDFPDFRPLHHYRCTTSLFLHREFRPKARSARLPPATIGGKDVADTNQWDEPLEPTGQR